MGPSGFKKLYYKTTGSRPLTDYTIGKKYKIKHSVLQRSRSDPELKVSPG